jgi:rhodanese-related sulfurtransferase
VWVHCAVGYRASIAASFLAAAGRRPVAIDDAFGSARQAGLPVTLPDAA